MTRMLLTNDDGIDAPGLRALVAAFEAVPDFELLVVAPDGDRSGAARSVSTGRGVRVWPVGRGSGCVSYATDGTPVDAVRLARLGLLDGFTPDIVISGVNHGLNLGDDITYSGTVAAAFEAVILGLPGIAVSQQSDGRELEFGHAGEFTFDHVAAFVVELVASAPKLPIRTGGLLSINSPAGRPAGVEVTRLVRRSYSEVLRRSPVAGGHVFRIETAPSTESPAAGTDAAAVASGRISVTPLHFDLMDEDGATALREFNLAAVLEHAHRWLQ